MTRLRLLCLALALAASLALTPAASAAPTVHYLAAGSSAMFQAFEVAVVNDLAETTPACAGGVGTSCTIHHYSINGACSGGTCAQIVDSRTAGIPNEPATLWIAYVCSGAGGCTGSNATNAWAYLSVDSVVGTRSFLARPRALALIDAGTQTTNSANNRVNPALLQFGVNSATSGCGASLHCDDQFLPADVWTGVSGATGVRINVGMTDIRPEDGKYATKRANKPNTGSPWNGLGYSTAASSFVGSPIKSAFSGTQATPVQFGLPGFTDPITSTAVPTTITTIPIGEAPILFLVNRTDHTAAGLGQGFAVGTAGFYKNVLTFDATQNPPQVLGNLFGGVNCSGSNRAFGAGGSAGVVTNLILRESMSGTMNTTEFSAFRLYGAPTFGGTAAQPTTSQEANINPPDVAPRNPLNLPCTSGGNRLRAIGTGEAIAKVKSAADGLGAATTNTLGYAFFSFGNVNTVATQNNFGYLQLDGVDPLFEDYLGGSDPGQPSGGTAYGANNGTFHPGTLPACDVTATDPNTPACTQAAVWVSNFQSTNPYCPATGPCSFPHLRDGSYKAWSLLRAVCDTADGQCTGSFGANAIIQLAQADIANNTSPPDFLPFDNVSVIRAHYQFNSPTGPANHDFPTVSFTGPAGLNQPRNVGSSEAGGDAGGCILGQTSGTLALTKATVVVNGNVKYDTTDNKNVLVGDVVTISGFTNGGNNGTFVVKTVLPGPPAQIKVKNTSGVNEMHAASGNYSPATATTNLNCAQ